MTEYLTEQEQIDQLKKWLRVYGLPALIGVIVGIIIFYGWNYYQSYRMRILTHASQIYDEMLTEHTHHNPEGTQIQAQKILKHYRTTIYGAMAALMLAQEATTQKNYPEALKQLSWIIDHCPQASIRQIARLRTARIYIANQHAEDALHLLQKVDDQSFIGLINEIRGDAYFTMHHISEAQAAYKQALQELPHSEEIRPLLEMKLDNLT